MSYSSDSKARSAYLRKLNKQKKADEEAQEEANSVITDADREYYQKHKFNVYDNDSNISEADQKVKDLYTKYVNGQYSGTDEDYNNELSNISNSYTGNTDIASNQTANSKNYKDNSKDSKDQYVSDTLSNLTKKQGSLFNKFVNAINNAAEHASTSEALLGFGAATGNTFGGITQATKESQKAKDSSDEAKETKKEIQDTYNTNDDAFNKYVNAIQYQQNEQKIEDEEESAKQYANDHKIASQVEDVMDAQVSNGMTALNYLKWKADPNKDEYLGFQNVNPFKIRSEAIKEQTEENIDNAIDEKMEDGIGKTIAQGAAKLGYQGAITGAEMLPSILLGNVAGEAIAGTSAGTKVQKALEGTSKFKNVNVADKLSAIITTSSFAPDIYNSAYDQALEQGDSTKQANQLAAVNVLASLATETLGTEVQTSLSNKLSQNALKTIGKSFKEEGLEEGVEDIIDTAADLVISGNKAQTAQEYQSYVNQGDDEVTAFGKTLANFAKSTAQDVAIGGISGALMATPGGISQQRNYNNYTSDLTKDGNYQQIADSISTNREDYNSEEDYKKALDVKANAESLANDISSDQVTDEQKQELANQVLDVNDSLKNSNLLDTIQNNFNTPEARTTEVDGHKVAKSNMTSKEVAKAMTGASNNKAAYDFVKAFRQSQTSTNADTRQTGQDYFNMLSGSFDAGVLQNVLEQDTAEDVYFATREGNNTQVEDQINDLANTIYTNEGQAKVADYANYIVKTQGLSQEEATQQAEQQVQEEIYNDAQNEVFNSVFDNDEQVQAYKQGMKEYNVNQFKQAYQDMKDEVKAVKGNVEDVNTYTDDAGNVVDVEDVNKDENGNVVVTTQDGQQVQVAIDNKADNASNRQFLSKMAELPTTEAKQAFKDNYDGKQAVGLYQMHFNNMYNYGATKTKTYDEMKASLKGGSKTQFDLAEKALGEDAARKIFEIGKNEKEDKNKFVAKEHKKTTGKVSLKLKELKEEDIKETPIYKLAKSMAKKLGLDIELTDEDINARGYLDVIEAKIVLDINDDNAFQTLIHEGIGEFLEAYDEDMQDVQDAIIEYLMQNSDWNMSVMNYRDAYIRSGEKNKSFREAFNEEINDAISGLLSTEEGMQDFVDWLTDTKSQEEAENIIEKIKNFINDLIECLHNIVNKKNLTPQARMLASQAEKDAKAMRDTIFSHMDKAIEYYQTGEVKQETKAELKAEEHKPNLKKVSNNTLIAQEDSYEKYAEIERRLMQLGVKSKDLQDEGKRLREIYGKELNDSLSKGILEQKKKHPYDSVREFLSGNQNVTPQDALEGLLAKYDAAEAEAKLRAWIKRTLNSYDINDAMQEKIDQLYAQFENDVRHSFDTPRNSRELVYNYMLKTEDPLSEERNGVLLERFFEKEGIDALDLLDNAETIVNREKIYGDEKSIRNAKRNFTRLANKLNKSFMDLIVDIGPTLDYYEAHRDSILQNFDLDEKAYNGHNYSWKRFQYFDISAVPVSTPSDIIFLDELDIVEANVFMKIADGFNEGETASYNHNFLFEKINNDSARIIDVVRVNAKASNVVNNLLTPVQNGVPYGSRRTTINRNLPNIKGNGNNKANNINDSFVLHGMGQNDGNEKISTRKESYGTTNNTSTDSLVETTEKRKSIDIKGNTTEEYINNLPTDKRFALDAPIEKTKSLIAVHNLTADELMQTIDLGGFPMPSIAIVKADMEHSKYGDVSIVFSKDTIDPKKSKYNKVYGGDAWTPTFPTLSYKVDSKRYKEIYEKIESLLDGISPDVFGYLGFDEDNLQNTLERYDGTLVNSMYYISTAIKLAYLKSKGDEVEFAKKDNQLSNKLSNDQVVKVSNKFKFEDLDQMTTDYNYGNDHKDLLNKVREYLNTTEVEEHKDYLEKRKAKFLENNDPKSEKAYKDLYDHYANFYNKNNFGSWELYELAKSIKEYRDNGIQQVNDNYATEDIIKNKIKEDEEGYKNFFEDLFDGIVEKVGIYNGTDWYTYSGNRRSWEATHDALTLNNIVKNMRKEDQKGNSFLSQMGIKALATKDFTSIADIHSAENQLQQINEEDYKELLDKHAARYYDIIDEILPGKEHAFIEREKISDVVADALRSTSSVTGIDHELRQYIKDIKDDTAQKLYDLMQDMANMPYGYFEAKPQRAVGLEEITKAIIPNNVDKALIDSLKSNNVPYETYEAGNEEQRANILNNTKDARFSIQVAPPVTLDPILAFKGTEEEQDELDRQQEAQKQFFRDIVSKPDFNSLEFDTDRQTIRVTPNVHQDLAGKWQITWFDDKGAVMDEKHDSVDSLAKALYRIVPREGAEVKVYSNNETDFEGSNDKRYSIEVLKQDPFNTRKSIDVDGVEFESTEESIAKELRDYTARIWHGIAKALNNEMDQKYIKAIARNTIEIYESSLGVNEVTDQINMIYSYAQQLNEEDESAYVEMMNALINLSKDIIDNPGSYNYSNNDAWKDYIDFVKTKTIKVSDHTANDLMAVFGKNWIADVQSLATTAGLKLAKVKGDYTDTLDDQFFELAKNAGFEIDKNDSIETILENMLSQGSAIRPKPSNAFIEYNNKTEGYMEVATRLMDLYFGYQEALSQEKGKESNITDETAKAAIKRARDSVNQKVAETKKKMQAEFDKKVAYYEKEIAERDEAINAIKKLNTYDAAKAGEKDKAIEKLEKEIEKARKAEAEALAKSDKRSVKAYKDRQDRQKYMNNIKRDATSLIRMMEAPTDKRHIPYVIQKPILELLNSIDFVSKSAKMESMTTQTWLQAMKDVETMLDEVDKTRGLDPEAIDTQQQAMLNNLSWIWDASLKEEVIALQSAKDNIAGENLKIKPSELTTNELQQLRDILANLKHGILHANDTFANLAYSDTTQLANDAMSALRQVDLYKNENMYNKWFKDTFNLELVDPVTYFEFMGDAGKSIFKSLLNGFSIRTKRINQAENFMKQAEKDLDIDEKDIKDWSKTLHELEINNHGKPTTIKLTTSQIMSLYCLMKREQAQLHILQGGVKPTSYKTKNIKENANQSRNIDPLHLTNENIQALTSMLSDKQIALADKMQEFMSTKVSDWGNNVTMKMFGYRKFEENNYFPISTDALDRMLNSSNDKNQEAGLRRLQNLGMTKNLVQNANGAILIKDVFDVFTGHVVDMANYEGYVLPIADTMRFLNYIESTNDLSTEYGEKDTYSVKKELKRALGSKGSQYLTQLIRDINGDMGNQQSSFLDRLFSMNKAQSVMANGRVVIQQPTAIVRAQEVIENKYLMQGLIGNLNAEAREAQKHNMLANWKAKGYFETNIGQSMKSIITGDASLQDKVNEYAGWLAGKADDITWGAIWHASKLKVEAEQNLHKGDQGFIDAVNEIFNETIAKTQVVDTTLTKSQVLRNKNGLVRMATTFMAEPNKTYNMLYRGLLAIHNGDKKALAKAIAIFVANGILVSLAQSIYDAWRDDEDDEKFLTRLMTALFPSEEVQAALEEGDLVTAMKKSLEGNITDNLNPLNTIPVLNDISSTIQGYDNTQMQTQFLSEIVDAIDAMQSDNKTIYGKLYAGAKAVSLVTGMPIANATREVKDLYNNINDLWNGENLKKSNSTGTTSKYADVYSAIDKGEDIASAVNDMMATATTDEEKKKMKTNMGSAITRKYKDQMKEAYTNGSGYADLANHLRQAYMACGYTSDEANKKIQNMLKSE